MTKKETLSVCEQHLFSTKEQMKHLAPQYVDRILRIRAAYTMWLDNPVKTQKEIVDFLLKFGIEKSAAYEDVRIIQTLLGNINKASKDFNRYKFNNMLDYAFERAKKKDNEDAMIKAANIYAKFNQLDKEEQKEYDWSQIMPQPFVPTSNPEILGIKPIPNIQKKIADLKAKYSADIEDVTYEDIDLEQLNEYAG